MSTVSSTPILRRTLTWSAVAAVALAAVAAIVGYIVAQGEGLVSGLLGVLISAGFLAITGISILIANRWYGQPLYVQLFFAIVLGGWMLKFVIFLVVMFLLRDQPWIQPEVFLISIVAGVIMSLVIDALVISKMRLPNVSDISLPTQAPDDVAPGTPSTDTPERS